MLEWTGTGSLHVLENAGDSGLELVESEEVKFVMYLVNCHLVRSVNDTEIPILLHSSWTPNQYSNSCYNDRVYIYISNSKTAEVCRGSDYYGT